MSCSCSAPELEMLLPKEQLARHTVQPFATLQVGGRLTNIYLFIYLYEGLGPHSPNALIPDLSSCLHRLLLSFPSSFPLASCVLTLHPLPSLLLPPVLAPQVPLSFTPSNLKAVNGEVTISCTSPPAGLSVPLSWRLPVRGFAEAKQSAGATFRFRSKARSKTVETIEIVLNGLAGMGPEEEFTHELIMHPEASQHLDGGAALEVRVGGLRV